MRLFPLFAFLLVLAIPLHAGAGQRSVTFYLDGARIEQEVVAGNGYLEYPLPESFTPGSLRVKPAGRGSVTRVEVVSAGAGPNAARETAKLEQQRIELQDRMQMLERREEIFRAAAKSQSGKAPRKTKTNPDPVNSLKQGTDFALGQLDAVYRSRQKCRRELDAVERKLAVAKKGKSVARIWVTGPKAFISYLVSSERWTPSYDFRWSDDGKGELLLHARLPRREKGVLYLVSNGTVAKGETAKAVREEFPLLSRHPLTLLSADGKPLEGDDGKAHKSAERPRSNNDRFPLSFGFSKIGASLPPGEGSAYWRGEYIGSGRFSGGESTEFIIGNK
jgi:hypothetical protein